MSQFSQRDSVVVADWTESPFTSYDRRGHVVEHRVVFERFADAGVDIRHEIRSRDENSIPAEWSEETVYEVRAHGVTKVDTDSGWFA